MAQKGRFTVPDREVLEEHFQEKSEDTTNFSKFRSFQEGKLQQKPSENESKSQDFPYQSSYSEIEDLTGRNVPKGIKNVAPKISTDPFY